MVQLGIDGFVAHSSNCSGDRDFKSERIWHRNVIDFSETHIFAIKIPEFFSDDCVFYHVVA